MITPQIILGPPGTGKTTRLLDILEMELEKTEPTKIAFCSFTKKAVNEAVDRAMGRFKFTPQDLPYFKTAHSLGFALLGLRRSNVMQQADYVTIGNELGLKFNVKRDVSDISYAGNPGDKYAFIMGYARARSIPYRLVWDDMDTEGLNWFEFQRFVSTTVKYKRDYNKSDFQDMLDNANTAPDIDVLILDEAQDLSTSQWLFIERVFSKAKRIYIAGDDDQAIYQWSGADVEHFIKLRGPVEQLHQSWRIPKTVHKLAEELSSRIQIRKNKQYTARDIQGSVTYWNDVDHVDISSGTWLLLARNAHYMNELTTVVKGKGYTYLLKDMHSVNQEHIRAIKAWENWRKDIPISVEEDTLLDMYGGKSRNKELIWHKALSKIPLLQKEYYISLLRQKESLTKTPRIQVNTIHGVKGGEAENVILLTDMTTATWEGRSMSPDAEHRVWYVGATRCKENLHIVRPRGRFYYEL